MPKLKELDNVDDLYNPSSKRAGSLLNHEQSAGEEAGVSDGVDQLEKYANDPANSITKNIDNVKQQENSSYYHPENSSNQTDRRSFSQKITGFAKSKKGATTGIFGGLGISGIILSSMFGGFTSFINVASNGTDTNDTRSTILDRRLAKWIDKKSSGGGCSDLKKYKCRMGRMPNKMLSQLATKNIKALDANGKEIKVTSTSGYVDENPAKYEFTDSGGNKTIIDAPDLGKTYKKNAAFRSSFKSAYNMRYRAWTGKNIAKIFYSKFGLKQDGGLASDGNDLSEANVDEKLDEKLNSSSTEEANADKKNIFRERFKGLIDKTAGKAKKTGGDPALVVGAGYCTAVNMPGFIAGAYRSIQLVQILLLINDTVLSPAGKIKAGDATADEVSALGNKLTESVDGKSALDSPILLSAMGVNKNKTRPSKFAPGYAAYSSSFIQGSNSVSATSKGFCNKITSPEAALAAGAVEGAISVGTAGAGAVVIGAIKGVLKIAIAIGAVDAAVKLLESSGVIDIIADQAFKLAEKLTGDYTDGIRGEKLGDALGVGILAYFSISGLRGGSAVLKTNQIIAFNQIIESNESDYRQEALATLSPFDTSSKYTFLGSIMSNISTSGLLSSNLMTSLSSAGSLVLNTPSTILSPAAGASADDNAQAAQNRCDHADMFDIEDDIAINAAGYPCVGIPADYMDVSVDDVYSEVEDQLDEDTGEWKDDSDIAEVQTDCQDADLEAIAGCTISDKKRAAESIYQYDKQVSDILDGSDDLPPATTEETQGSTVLNIASFNVRGASHDGEKGTVNYVTRMKRTVETIQNEGFDVIGFQEFEPRQREEFNKSSIASTYTLSSNDARSDNGNAIAWNSSKYELVDQGTQPNLLYTVGNELKAPWVKLREKGGSSREFYFMNTHDPANVHDHPATKNAYRRTDNAKEHVNFMKEKAAEGVPVFITGDFNSTFNKRGGDKDINVTSDNINTTLPYCIMTSDGSILNAFDTYKARDAKCPNNDIAWAKEAPGKGCSTQIDHLYYTSELLPISITDFGCVKKGDKADSVSDGNGSDHDTVKFQIAINGDDSSGSSGEVAWPVNEKYYKIDKNNFLEPHGGAGTFTPPNTGDVSDDISLPDGTAVYALTGGKVIQRPLGRSSHICTGIPDVSNNGGLMIQSKLKDGGTLTVAYAHGDNVISKDTVETGEQIMTVGRVGNSCGYHLHIDMSYNGHNVCPQDVFLALSRNETINWSELSKKASAPCARS